MNRVLALAAAALLAAPSAQAASLLANGDFEGGNTGFTSGYLFTPGGNTNAAQYNVAQNPQAWNGGFTAFGDNTSGTGNMFMVNGATSVGATVWSQTVSVSAGTAYTFDGWIAALFPGASQISLDINGSDLGTITGPSATGQWQDFSFGWNSGAATSATLSLLQQTTGFGGNDYALDDLSFTADPTGPSAAIPLPASLPLLLAGLGGIAALRRRRARE